MNQITKELHGYYIDQKKEHWGSFQCEENRKNMTFEEWVEYELWNGKKIWNDNYDGIDHDWQTWIMKLEDVFMRIRK